MKQYHTLLIKIKGQWCPTFGDYDIALVREERDIEREAGVPIKHTKIITTRNTQAAINERVAVLNAASAK